MRPVMVLLMLLALGLYGGGYGDHGSPPGEANPATVECANARPGATGSTCSPTCPRLAALNSEIATLKEQLRVWGDRGRVDLIESIICQENPSIPFQSRRDIAKAFIKASDRLQIPLLAGVAIADVESKFSNKVLGHHGESSLMQILPLPGRPSRSQLRSDPKLAIDWALENLVAPPYHQAVAEGGTSDEALKTALKNYNRHDDYVEKVYRRYLSMKDFEAKGLYGWE